MNWQNGTFFNDLSIEMTAMNLLTQCFFLPYKFSIYLQDFRKNLFLY